jgi:hypothetical protein
MEVKALIKNVKVMLTSGFDFSAVNITKEGYDNFLYRPVNWYQPSRKCCFRCDPNSVRVLYFFICASSDSYEDRNSFTNSFP